MLGQLYPLQFTQNILDDLMVHAPTGQGKTAAFLIPLIQTISCLKRQLKIADGAVNSDSPFAIIFLHTRDLADQVYAQASQLVKGKWSALHEL